MGSGLVLQPGQAEQAAEHQLDTCDDEDKNRVNRRGADNIRG